MRIASSLIGLLLASSFVVPAQAQVANSAADNERIERKLDELRKAREDMQRQMGALQNQMGQFDNQIDALEAELHPGQPAAPQVAAVAPPPSAPVAETTNQPVAPPARPVYVAEDRFQAETEKYP